MKLLSVTEAPGIMQHVVFMLEKAQSIHSSLLVMPIIRLKLPPKPILRHPSLILARPLILHISSFIPDSDSTITTKKTVIKGVKAPDRPPKPAQSCPQSSHTEMADTVNLTHSDLNSPGVLQEAPGSDSVVNEVGGSAANLGRCKLD